MNITKNIEAEITLTPEEIAVLFCNMDEFEQATFFNTIANEVVRWDAPFEFQLAAIFMKGGLNKGGSNIMRLIGESVAPAI